MSLRNRFKRCLALKFIVGLLVYIILQIEHYRLSIVGWEMTVSRNVSDYIFPNISTTLIKPTDFCNTEAFLIVFICSSPFHFEARQVIRKSWGLSKNISNVVVNVYFVLGLTRDLEIQEDIKSESEMYNDVIQENFMDSYNNLTLKSSMILKLVINDCKNKVRYVMKTDDDVFVNAVNLVNKLRSIPRNQEALGVLFGYLMCNVHPVRDSYEKWYVPVYMYADRIYPNYLSGTAYIMSANVCNRLFEVALETPLIYLEDVFLTGICARKANIRPRHNIHFRFKRVEYNPCHYRHVITTHSFSPSELYELYNNIHNLDLENECTLYKQNLKKNSTALAMLPKFKKVFYRKGSCF